MDREAALKAIQENVKNENLIKHMLATEAIMRALCSVASIPILKKRSLNLTSCNKAYSNFDGHTSFQSVINI